MSGVTKYVAILAHQCVFVRDHNTQRMLFEYGYGATRTQSDSKKNAKEEQIEAADIVATSLLLLDEEALYLTINQHITIYRAPPPSISKPVDYDLFLSSSQQSPSPCVLAADDLYEIFFKKNSKFPLKYKVYAYFRDKGCCVHTAVNYGLDYAVYQTLPTLCHSALSALVIDGVHDGNRNESGSDDTLRWTHMSAMTRVMGDVSKLLLLCHVIPADIQYFNNNHPCFDDHVVEQTSVIDLSHISCLGDLAVMPVTATVRRHIADNSDNYTTVQSMQKNFSGNLKVIKSGGGGAAKANKDKKKAPPKKRKRNSEPSESVEEREVKVSRHAKHWKSLYTCDPQQQMQAAGCADEEENREEERNSGGLFGWLGSLLWSSEN